MIPLTSLKVFLSLSLLLCVDSTNTSFYSYLVSVLMKLTSLLGLLAVVAVQFPFYVLSVHSKILFQKFCYVFYGIVVAKIFAKKPLFCSLGVSTSKD